MNDTHTVATKPPLGLRFTRADFSRVARGLVTATSCLIKPQPVCLEQLEAPCPYGRLGARTMAYAEVGHMMPIVPLLITGIEAKWAHNVSNAEAMAMGFDSVEAYGLWAKGIWTDHWHCRSGEEYEWPIRLNGPAVWLIHFKPMLATQEKDGIE